MEQESETPLLYDTLRRIGYKLSLVAHAIFMASALIGIAFLLTTLVVGALLK